MAWGTHAILFLITSTESILVSLIRYSGIENTQNSLRAKPGLSRVWNHRNVELRQKPLRKTRGMGQSVIILRHPVRVLWLRSLLLLGFGDFYPILQFPHQKLTVFGSSILSTYGREIDDVGLPDCESLTKNNFVT